MKEKFFCKCETCLKIFEIKKCELEKRRFCSKQCMNLRIHTWARNKKYLIEKATQEEKREKLIQAYEKNIVRKDGCWDWNGFKDKLGSGLLSCRIQYAGTQRVSRASWIIHKGQIPKGMVVMHTCDNPSCSNPDHLKLGTPLDNSRDMVNKRRQALGSKNPNAKLDEEKVKKIKLLLSQGMSYPKIANLFSVGIDTISNIKRGITWRHVEVPNE